MSVQLQHVSRALLRRVVDYALPPRCPGCGVIVADDHAFCLPCWQALDFLGGPACAVCAEPLELALHADSRCGACLADPPPFDRLRAGVAYGPIARALALKLKHGGRAGIARTMARLMARAVGPQEAGVLIVPVPLHRRRLWWRGYNQSALIARALAMQVGGTVAIDALRRTKRTPLLRGLGPVARRRAVSGAFAVDPSAKARVKGARILLVDDVYTTGATVVGCAKALKRAGAAEVSIACWARVVKGRDETEA
ncbi:ComF family protein [Sphingomonas sp. AP4-R1]|uniref:ComF family protein n=1 Tax=Sphingomonas sp. AP4-R1 TaxID=2735134 RepID=UPI0014936CCE|nr:ComF family protein [Sphingomonas sp. AP4-R1]QJU57693.1 ComF family protein [Sphingomonas sp. AP4-R1]